MKREPFRGAMGVLPPTMRSDLLALQRFLRHVEQTGGGRDREPSLQALRIDIHRMYNGGQPACEDVSGLRPIVQRHAIPIGPWLDLIEASRIDQLGHRYDTFEEVLGHCALAANPVGRIALGVFDRSSAYRVALSDRVCTALQLIQHLQNLGQDYLRGRVYLPQDDLRRFGVDEHDLGRPRATPALTALVAYEADRASCWLESGSILASTLHGWARILLSGWVNRGRVLLREIEQQGFDPLGGISGPTHAQIAAQWVHASVRSAG